MAFVVDLQTEVVHKYVLELRYDFGYVYWDRAGRIAREIASLEGWTFQSMDLNTCQLAMPEVNMAFRFGHQKLDLSQEQNKDVKDLKTPAEFAATADLFARTVANTLELDTFTRIGFRAWYLYRTSTKEDAFERLQRLKLFQIDPFLVEQLGDVSDRSHTIVVERPSNMLRIAVTAFEQNVNIPPSVIAAARARARDAWRDQKQVMMNRLRAKKLIEAYPPQGIMLDLDASMEEPPYPMGLSVSDFVTRAAEDFGAVKKAVLLET